MKLSEKLTVEEQIKDHISRAMNLSEKVTKNKSFFQSILDEVVYEDQTEFISDNGEISIKKYVDGSIGITFLNNKSLLAKLFGLSSNLSLDLKTTNKIVNFLNK